MGMSALEVRRRVMLAQPHEAVASGAVASFRTDVVSPLPMEFDLVPIQDLHGQANPYPAGGGKNLLDYDTVMPNLGFTKQSDGSWYTASSSAVGMKTLWENTGEIAGSISITYTYKYNSSSSQGSRFKFLYTDGTITDNYAGATESYFTKSFTSNAEKTLLKIETTYGTGSVSTWIKDIQVEIGSATSFAPYSNICPITGHDGFTRTGTGKNLFDGEVHNMAFVAQSGGKADIQGNAYWRSIYARVEGGKTYTISRTTIETNRFRMVATVDEPTVGDDAVILNNSADNDSLYAATVTIPDGYNYLFIYLSNQGTTVTPGNYQIELGSHATTIVPYQGHSYSTTFPTPPGTVYGGHVTDNGDGTGTLVVDRAIAEFDGDAGETWYFSTSSGKYRVFNTSSNYSGLKITGSYSSDFESNYIKPSGSSLSMPNVWEANFSSIGTFIIGVPSTITSENDWLTYLSQNPLQVCYPLDTTVVYTLSMTAIQSIIGQNNIWVDNADSVSVEYWGH